MPPSVDVLDQVTPCCRKYTQFCAYGQATHRAVGVESDPVVGRRMIDSVLAAFLGRVIMGLHCPGQGQSG
jgi:hypothetical protein